MPGDGYSVDVSFPEVEQVHALEVNFVHGISPSAFVLSLAPQPNFLGVGGDLVIDDGAMTYTFSDCKVDQATLDFNAQGLLWRLTLLDRRWKWAFPTISGAYNLRQDTVNSSIDPIVTGTEQTPQQLATLLLEAMGEEDFDVSDMPNDQRPTVHWQSANAARELANLADMLNCRVVLQLDDSVAIRVAGKGQNLPDGGIMEDSLTIDPPERPDSIGICCAPTRYQIDAPLVAVGLDTDDTVRPIDQLSYAPSGGWAGADFPGLQSLKQTNYPAWERATKSVLRWYQIQFPLAVAAAGEVASMQFLGPIFDEQVNLIDDPLSSDYRRQPAQVFGVWWTQGEVQTDNLVSLYPAANSTLPPIDPSNLTTAFFYQGGFSLDREQGIVMLHEPLHRTPRTVLQSSQSSSSETGASSSSAAYFGVPAQLYLRTSTNVRDSETWGWLCYECVQQFGDQFGTATQFEQHGELELNVAPVYESGSFTISDTTDNSALIDAQCDAYIDAINSQYVTENPETHRYNSLVDVELDGAIQQVAIDLSVGGFTMTISRSSELLHRSVSYQERRMLERAQKLKNQTSGSGIKHAHTRDTAQQTGSIG